MPNQPAPLGEAGDALIRPRRGGDDAPGGDDAAPGGGPPGDAPLRILYLTPYFRPYLGGIERAIEELSRQARRSPQVEAVAVLTTKYSFPRQPQPDWDDRDAAPDGTPIFRLPGFPRRSLPFHSVPLVWFPPGRIRQYLDEFRPNVIHIVGDGWFWGHFWCWFFYRRRARFVFTPSFHTLPPWRWWLRPLNAILCRLSDVIVSLTRQEAAGVRRAYLAPRHKQRIIGWGAPAPQLPRSPADTGGGGGDSVYPTASSGRAESATRPSEHTGMAPAESAAPLTILCVGRLGRHKGQLWLLEVYRQARAAFRRPVRLALVGRDEGDAAAVAAFIAANGLEGEVAAPGEVPDGELARWYAGAGLFVLFSQFEAFGLVYFEAMAYGVPVLTHDVGANRELLRQGAVVTPRYDRAAAAAELARLVNDEGARRRLAAAARDYALTEFTWPAVARQYLQAYRG